MDHLDEISVGELQDALDNVEGNKPTHRLLAAIAYKNGVTQTELAEWHDTGRRTIYSWLKRLDIVVKTSYGHKPFRNTASTSCEQRPTGFSMPRSHLNHYRRVA